MAQRITVCTQQAFQDGFPAGLAHGKREDVDKFHAATRTVDKSKIDIQTDSVDSRPYGQEPNISRYSVACGADKDSSAVSDDLVLLQRLLQQPQMIPQSQSK